MRSCSFVFSSATSRGTCRAQLQRVDKKAVLTHNLTLAVSRSVGTKIKLLLVVLKHDANATAEQQTIERSLKGQAVPRISFLILAMLFEAKRRVY
jgi:hypothetical protein